MSSIDPQGYNNIIIMQAMVPMYYIIVLCFLVPTQENTHIIEDFLKCFHLYTILTR